MGDEVAKLYIEFDANGAPYIRGLRNLDTQTHLAGRRMTDAWKKYGAMAGAGIAAGLAAGTAALVALGTASVKAAANFEYEMSRIKANASGTAAEMKKLEATVIQLGKKTAFSAGETAQAANELVKAGLALGETMEALPGMLDLAAAGELGVAQAAELTANTLSQFSLETKDAAMVADVLANAANKSTTGVTEMGQSLENVATIAANMGWTLQETSAALALLANNGVKGAEAGTSLKSMLMQLMTPTEAAADMMERYGVSLYDANGESVTAEVLLERLEKAFVGLSDADRDLAAGTIFGSYGIKAANILIKEGADAFADMTKEVSELGAAQDIAATKMDNLAGSYEQLKGSIETALIAMGKEGIPGVREAVDELTETVNDFIGAWDRMTATDAWKHGGFEVRLALATDTILDTLETLVRKAGESLRDVDWTLVGSTIADVVYRSLEIMLPELVKTVIPGAAELAGGFAWSQLQGPAKMVMGWGGQGGSLTDARAYSRYLAQTNPGLYRAMGGTEYLDGQASGSLFNSLFDLSGVQDKVIKKTEQMEQLWLKNNMAMSDARKQAEEFQRALETLGLTEEELAGYTETLAGLYSSMTSPADIWQEAEQSLSRYLVLMDAQLASWENFEGNLHQLASQFGPEFGADVIMAAAALGPEFVASLVGADPAVVRRALEGLETQMGQTMDGLARAIAEDCQPVGEQSSDSYVEAWTDHFKAQSAYLAQSVTETLPTDASTEGGLLGTSYANAFLTRVKNTLSGLGLFGGTAGVFPGPTVGSNLPGTHDVGGPLPHGTMAINMSGATEYVVTEDLPREIQNLIGELRSDLGPDGDLARSIMSAFSERSSIAGSYISRERGRYSMLEAEGAPIERLEEVLLDQIRFITDAVAEAEAQLDAAKAQGLPAEDINDLAENLFDLREDAAKAREELDELARVPLERAADMWSGKLDMLEELFDMLSQSSSGMADALALVPQMMGAAQAELDSYIDLLDQATDASERLAYAQDAMGSILTMFDIERQAIETTLRAQIDALDRYHEEATAAFDAQSRMMNQAAQAARDIASARQEALRDQHNQALEELRAYYDAQLDVMDEYERELDRRALMSEMQSLFGAQSKTTGDLDRIQAIRKQLAEGERTDARRALQDERDAAIKALEAQQEEAEKRLQAQIEAQERMLEAQRESLDAQRAASDRAYDEQRAILEANAQEQIDLAAEKYAKEIEIIMAMATDVTAAINEMTGVVIDSTLAKVDTTLGGGPGGGSGGRGSSGGGGSSSGSYAGMYSAGGAVTGVGYWDMYATEASPGAGYEWDPWLYKDGGGTRGAWKKTNYLSHATGEADALYGQNMYEVINPAYGIVDPYDPRLGGATVRGLTPAEAAERDAAMAAYYGSPDYAETQRLMTLFAARQRTYDDGGWLMPGVTLAANFTGVPERVAPPGGFQDSLDVRFHITTDGPITDAQAERLADVLERKLTLRQGRNARNQMFIRGR